MLTKTYLKLTMDAVDETSNCGILDLYDDLITDENNKKQEDYKELEIKYEEALARIGNLEKELEECRSSETEFKKKAETLEKNISNLLVTARSEIQRKDRELSNLRSRKSETPMFKKLMHRPNFRPRSYSTNSQSEGETSGNYVDHENKNTVLPRQSNSNRESIGNAPSEDKENLFKDDHRCDSRKRKLSPEKDVHDDAKKYRYGKELYRDRRHRHSGKFDRDKNLPERENLDSRHTRESSVVPKSNIQDTAKKLLEKSKHDLRRKSGEIRKPSESRERRESSKDRYVPTTTFDSRYIHRKRSDVPASSKNSRYSKERSSTPDNRSQKHDSASKNSRSERKMSSSRTDVSGKPRSKERDSESHEVGNPMLSLKHLIDDSQSSGRGSPENKSKNKQSKSPERSKSRNKSTEKRDNYRDNNNGLEKNKKSEDISKTTMERSSSRPWSVSPKSNKSNIDLTLQSANPDYKTERNSKRTDRKKYDNEKQSKNREKPYEDDRYTRHNKNTDNSEQIVKGVNEDCLNNSQEKQVKDMEKLSKENLDNHSLKSDRDKNSKSKSAGSLRSDQNKGEKEKYRSKSPERNRRSISPHKNVKDSLKTPSSLKVKTPKSFHKSNKDRESLDEWDAMNYRVADERMVGHHKDNRNRRSLPKTDKSSLGSKHKHFSESDSEETVSTQMKSCIVKSIENSAKMDRDKSKEKNTGKDLIEQEKTQEEKSPKKKKEKIKKKGKQASKDNSQLINLEKDREALLRELEMMNDSRCQGDNSENSLLSVDSEIETRDVSLKEKCQSDCNFLPSDGIKDSVSLKENISLKSNTSFGEGEHKNETHENLGDNHGANDEDIRFKTVLPTKSRDADVTNENEMRQKSQRTSITEGKDRKNKKVKKHCKEKEKKNKKSTSKESANKYENICQEFKSCNKDDNKDFNLDHVIESDASNFKNVTQEPCSSYGKSIDNLQHLVGSVDQCDLKLEHSEVDKGSTKLQDELRSEYLQAESQSTICTSSQNNNYKRENISPERSSSDAWTEPSNAIASIDNTNALLLTNVNDNDRAISIKTAPLAAKQSNVDNVEAKWDNYELEKVGSNILSDQYEEKYESDQENFSKSEVEYSSVHKSSDSMGNAHQSIEPGNDEHSKISEKYNEVNDIKECATKVHCYYEKRDLEEEEILNNSIIISEEMNYTEIDNDLELEYLNVKSVSNNEDDKKQSKESTDDGQVKNKDIEEQKTVESVNKEEHKDLEEGELNSDSDDEHIKVSLSSQTKVNESDFHENSINAIQSRDSERGKLEKESSKNRRSFKEKSRKESDRSKRESDKSRREPVKHREHDVLYDKHVKYDRETDHSSRRDKESVRKPNVDKTEPKHSRHKERKMDKTFDKLHGDTRIKEREMGDKEKYSTKVDKKRKEEMSYDRSRDDHRKKGDKGKVSKEDAKNFDTLDKKKTRYDYDKNDRKTDEMHRGKKSDGDEHHESGSKLTRKRISKKHDDKSISSAIKSVKEIHTRDKSHIRGELNTHAHEEEREGQHKKCEGNRDIESKVPLTKGHGTNSEDIEHNTGGEQNSIKGSCDELDNRKKRKRGDIDEAHWVKEKDEIKQMFVSKESQATVEEDQAHHSSGEGYKSKDRKDDILDLFSEKPKESDRKSETLVTQESDNPVISHELCEKPRKRHKSVRKETEVGSKYVDDLIVMNKTSLDKIITSGDVVQKDNDTCSSLIVTSQDSVNETRSMHEKLGDSKKFTPGSVENVNVSECNQEIFNVNLSDEDDIDIMGMEEDESSAKQSDILKQVAETEESFTCSRTRVWYRQPKHFESNTTIEHGFADINDTDSCSSIMIDDNATRVSKRNTHSNSVCQSEVLISEDPISSVECLDGKALNTPQGGKTEERNPNCSSDLRRTMLSHSSSKEISQTSNSSDNEDPTECSGETRVVTLIPAINPNNANNENNPNVDSDTDKLEPIPLGLKRGYKIPKVRKSNKQERGRQNCKPSNDLQEKTDHSRSHSRRKQEKSRCTSDDEKHHKKVDHRSVKSPRDEKYPYKDSDRHRHKSGDKDHKSSSLQEEHGHRRKSKARHYSSSEHETNNKDRYTEDRSKSSSHHQGSDSRHRLISVAKDKS